MEEDPALPSSRVTSATGSEPGYTTCGDPRRPAVLFLHGFMGSSGDWRDVMAALAERSFCVAVDLPGHGVSVGLPPESYTFEGAARAVISVLDELGIKQTVFAGYSMGGRLALYIALRHPERCAGLFLESASPGLESAEERRSRRATDEERAFRLESGDFEEFVRDWYRQPLFASLARDEGLMERAISARLKNDPMELAKSLRGMSTGNQPSLWRELIGLEAPALAIAGELDEKFVGISRRMQATNSRMKVAVVSGVGHNVHAEAPGSYLDLSKSFLRAS